MNRFLCQVIQDEDIYRTVNVNYLSNKSLKTVSLKYESVTIDEKIAQGGYGMVFKAHSFNKQYALKKLCVNNKEKLLNCIQEIFILKHIQSNYVLHLVDSIVYLMDTDIYEIYILTDYYPGALATEIKSRHSSNRNFNEDDVLRIMMNISEAVACLHHFLSHPIIHRDLKIENILIGYPMRYVLCDFGSATFKEIRPCDVNRQELQDEISLFTTLAYRSPEMADLYFDAGEHIIGRKSDIWAMGVMMYNICFFTLPFGDSVLSILSSQFTIPDHCSYSNNLLKIINYCLTPHPEKRPDIYQLSTLLFSISSKPNPVQNYEKSKEPNWNNLSLPTKESEAKLGNSTRKQKHITKNMSSQPIATSIKPRDRPKPGGKLNNIQATKYEDIAPNTASAGNDDLLVFDAPSQDEIGDDGFRDELSNNNKSLDGFGLEKIDNCQVPDLMDFNASLPPTNGKIKQLLNTSRSQSLGRQFEHSTCGQRLNVYGMISQSYQNQTNIYNSQINSMTSNLNFSPVQFSNPFCVTNMTTLPHYHSQNCNNVMQYGHRRLISDPSTWYQNPVNSNQSSSLESSDILQPRKIPLKKTVTNVLDEFDPLTK